MANEQSKGSNKILYILLALLLLSNLGVAYLYLQEKDKVMVITEEKGTLQNDKLALEAELSDMLSQYEGLETQNSELSAELEMQKQKIEELLKQAKKHENDAYIIYKLKKEAETLRNILKGHLHTIDSLNTANQTLIAEKAAVEEKLENKNQELNQLSQVNDNLSEKVKIGSKLKTLEMFAMAQRVKGNGIQRETNRANRAEKIKCCMTIDKNEIAKKGNYNVYLRIIAPSGKVLLENNEEKFFDYNGIKGVYSLTREVKYENEELDLCVYYDVVEGSELEVGTYTIEAYADNYDIGSATFELK